MMTRYVIRGGCVICGFGTAEVNLHAAGVALLIAAPTLVTL